LKFWVKIWCSNKAERGGDRQKFNRTTSRNGNSHIISAQEWPKNVNFYFHAERNMLLFRRSIFWDLQPPHMSLYDSSHTTRILKIKAFS
jgi:hypothetical protein